MEQMGLCQKVKVHFMLNVISLVVLFEMFSQSEEMFI